MLELDLILLVQLAGVVFFCWFAGTQIIMPIARKQPLLPAFRKKDALAEILRLREEQLKKDLEIAKVEEEQAKLEAALDETKNHAEQIRRRQSERN